MRWIDEQFLEAPFYGARQMTWHLRAEGHPVNEKRVRRLMRLMGLMPIYQRASPIASFKFKCLKNDPNSLKLLLVTKFFLCIKRPYHRHRLSPSRSQKLKPAFVKPHQNAPVILDHPTRVRSMRSTDSFDSFLE